MHLHARCSIVCFARSAGPFPIHDEDGKGEERYFGLRIRHSHDNDIKTIIPVNITVGTAGGVLITLKSERSVPPYRVVNRCRDVHVHVRQKDWEGSRCVVGAEAPHTLARVQVTGVPGGCSIPAYMYQAHTSCLAL